MKCLEIFTPTSNNTAFTIKKTSRVAVNKNDSLWLVNKNVSNIHLDLKNFTHCKICFRLQQRLRIERMTHKNTNHVQSSHKERHSLRVIDSGWTRLQFDKLISLQAALLSTTLSKCGSFCQYAFQKPHK